MAAPFGNKYWLHRKTHGRQKQYTPEELWEGFADYHQWCIDNPWFKVDFRGKDNDRVEIPTERPMTLKGLCSHLDIIMHTFEDYEKLHEYSPITTRIREIIYTHKFEGAAVGAFNANLIAREIGLADKAENKVQMSGDAENPLTLTTSQLSEISQNSLDELANAIVRQRIAEQDSQGGL